MPVFAIAYLTALAAVQAAPTDSVLPSPSNPPLVGISPQPSATSPTGLREMAPVEAVLAAADAAPSGAVRAVFVMPVRRAERVGPRFFLNSEADYRDQRNLSVAIQPAALRALTERFGDDLQQAFLGRQVRVSGQARRVRIDFTVHGRPTGKYYYQTHVDVVDARQITLD